MRAPKDERAKDKLPGSIPAGSNRDDRVWIGLDWVDMRRSEVTFRADISRFGRQSSITFSIDLGNLPRVELRRLEQLLCYELDQERSGIELTRLVTYLLDQCLRQEKPEWSAEERNLKVGELMMATVPADIPGEIRIDCALF